MQFFMANFTVATASSYLPANDELYRFFIFHHFYFLNVFYFGGPRPPKKFKFMFGWIFFIFGAPKIRIFSNFLRNAKNYIKKDEKSPWGSPGEAMQNQ